MDNTQEQPEELVECVNISTSTQCDHFYIEGGLIGGLKEVFCTKCPSGMQVSPETKIEEGKIQWNR